MIGKAMPYGKGFLGLARYSEKGHAGEERERVFFIETRNLPTEDAETAARLMAAHARESIRTQRPVYHLVISCDPGDPADRTSLSRVADTVLRELGLSEHQVLIVAHKDTAHPHMHLIVNRVHPVTHRAWENSWDWPKIEKALRSEEVALGFRIVPGKHAPVPGREPSAPAPKLERGDAAFLSVVRERAGPVLARAESWAEVEQGLAGLGLSVRVKGGGLSINDGRQEVKASDVDRAFGRTPMETRLGKLSAHRAQRLAAPEPQSGPLAPDPVRPATREPEAAPVLEPVQPPALEPQPIPAPAPPVARVQPQIRPEPASLGPVLSPTGAPAPEPEQVAEPEPTVARVQPPEPAQPVPAPLPIPTPERPVRRPPPRQPAKQPPAPPAPQPEPPVPEYLRPLVEAIRRGGAVEAEAERLDGIIAAANTAQRNADDLGQRARRAESAIEELREALLPVYADRSAAYRQMRQFRETHTNYELHTALRKAPEQFGDLKAKTVYPMWGLWVVPRPDYSEARDKAPGIAAPLDALITALPRRPEPEEVEGAKAEANNLRGPGQKAQAARLKLPQSFTYEGEVKALMRPLAYALGPDELDRQLWPLLEGNRHAHELARRVLRGVETALRREWERDRDRGRGVGGLGY